MAGRQHVLDAFAACDPFKELAATLYRETFWLVGDHLGTPRMVADRTGSLAGIKRHDYLPFGEELYAGTGGRTTTQGYGAADNVRQKFTGYERDDETKLDYAQARYYTNVQGRFTSIDPLPASAKPGQPQSWNRYTYALNNPLAFVDPSGLVWGRATNGDGKQTGRPIWYKNSAAMEAAGATEFSPENLQYQADDGRWVQLRSTGPDPFPQTGTWYRQGWEYIDGPSPCVEKSSGPEYEHGLNMDNPFEYAAAGVGGKFVGALGGRIFGGIFARAFATEAGEAVFSTGGRPQQRPRGLLQQKRVERP